MVVRADGDPGCLLEAAFCDAVFHFAAGAVTVFIKRLRIHAIGRQRRDDESRVLTFRQVFGFADDATFARPRLPRFVREVFEDARGLAGLFELLLRLLQFAADDLRQPCVLLQTNDVVDVILLAPRQNRVATEPAAHEVCLLWRVRQHSATSPSIHCSNRNQHAMRARIMIFTSGHAARSFGTIRESSLTVPAQPSMSDGR
jgi:hypothetical protein